MPTRRADGTLVFKIVYWGAVGSGKSTAMDWIYKKEGLAAGDLKNFKDSSDITYFERMVARVSNVFFQIYGVVGGKRNKEMRKAILRGADGIIFVWDSQEDRWEKNVESFNELIEIYGEKIKRVPKPYTFPLVICANKRDLENIVEIKRIREFLIQKGFEENIIYEVIAINGPNIKKSFVYTCREAVMNHYNKLRGAYDKKESDSTTKPIEASKEITKLTPKKPIMKEEEIEKFKLEAIKEFLEKLGLDEKNYTEEDILNKIGLKISEDIDESQENMDVFISYAIKDSAKFKIMAIAEELQGREGMGEIHYWEGWTGYPDGSVIRFIEQNLTKSQIFIAVCTDNSLNSKNCQKERDMAYFQNKRVIPLFEDFNKVPIIFQPYKGVNVVGKNPKDIVDEIYLMLFP
ncbi:MAG: TIR domain-containing protein [Promethearchaeota archaeon]|nr:MAG: TIR domain-containing protein [Candidatus Lokiarchaeota archaeon]